MRAIALIGAMAVSACSTNLHQLKDPKTRKPIAGAFRESQTTETQFRALATPAVLVDVKSATLPGFDRLLFTFNGKNVPSYQLKYLGQGVPAVFEMRFGARGNWPNGKAGVKSIQRRLDYPMVRSVSQAKVGEEYVFWTATLSKATAYRVTEMSNPPRIVIDFQHLAL